MSSFTYYTFINFLQTGRISLHWTSSLASHGESSWRYFVHQPSCPRWIFLNNAHQSGNLPSWSNIVSHLPKMKCFIPFKLRLFSLISAKILPGVPTTMCGQISFSVAWSFLMLMPSKEHTSTNTIKIFWETLIFLVYLKCQFCHMAQHQDADSTINRLQLLQCPRNSKILKDVNPM